MCSGGRDSSCLLHLCASEAGAASVRALHVNYGLRAEADLDEAACARLCVRLGVSLVVERAGSPPPGNLQAWAREVRYAAARRLARELGPETLIAAGHTADDQVETILYRLLSSPSRRAVLGMPQRDGRLVRPLLGMTRAQTTAYCERFGLPWREDESNASGAYVRNRIRNELLPLIRELHPGAEANLLALAARLRAEGEVLDGLVEAELADGLVEAELADGLVEAELADGLVEAELANGLVEAELADGLVEAEVPDGRIALARLRALPSALARLVVQRLADDALRAACGCGVAAGAGRRAPEIAALSECGTVALDIGHGLRAISEYGVLRVSFGGDTGKYQRFPPQSLLVPGEVAFAGGRVVCELTEPAPRPGVLDRDALGDRLIVRSWRAGDRIAPLGLGGSKSLQNLFTARKVPREQRSRLAIVESDGEIAWVEGVAISERFKVTAATRRAVRLSAVRTYTAER